ncbi:hypothetical protein IGI04_033299 [Brassica rapa subsp. trilocularis]|uniref:Uncharacterized protein n=1 Tax=Brassica rapa subsp. trilocularis TaxID=1813537 RepID=A0ABQ7L5G1_BRACM|nr:hypothetical protein IGI04_033299 [Brassica rapa subsp. trilocularis]
MDLFRMDGVQKILHPKKKNKKKKKQRATTFKTSPSQVPSLSLWLSRFVLFTENLGSFNLLRSNPPFELQAFRML